ncbi:MAG: hypothetical protein HRU09_17115 [Oligoflexales bacterium]|nr:hypothetical protein [Oligoflexales bacterium]
MQSITNTMSIQMFLIVVFGLIKSVFCQTKSLLTSLFTSGFILFSMPSHNMIINAKVEPLLLGIACCVLAILYLLQTNNQRALSFFLSFFLVAPLSCKIIWIHFMISFSVLFLFSVRKIRSNLNVRYLLLGTLVGVFTCLPFLIKNYYFFDNPVHPVQFSFLRSDRWTTMMQEYWSDISKKAGNLQEYFLILLKVPFNYMWSIKYFLIGCLLWFQVKDKKGFLQKEGAMLNRILLMLGVAFLLWPIFYNADVFPRFYFPLIALAIIPFVLLYKHSHQSKWFFVILVIPFLFSSSMEVKLSGMKRNMGNTIDDFYDAMPSPMGERNGENVINIHRKSLSKNFSLSEKAVLADTPVAYFLDGMLLYLEGLDYGFYRETMAQENPKSKKCVWIFLKQFNINYLYAARTNFSNWPSEYEDVIGQAELVNKEGSIRYVSDSLINAAINNCSD